MGGRTSDAALAACAERLVRMASAAGATVATAESCTAGMVASSIAGVPGASEVLLGGAVTYCDAVKHRVLGVPLELLERYTAVSPQVAEAMARGARELFGSVVAVSLTGYAGPGGGTADDPVGTVYFGFATPGGCSVERMVLAGSRNEVRAAACLHALEGVAARL